MGDATANPSDGRRHPSTAESGRVDPEIDTGQPSAGTAHPHAEADGSSHSKTTTTTTTTTTTSTGSSSTSSSNNRARAISRPPPITIPSRSCFDEKQRLHLYYTTSTSPSSAGYDEVFSPESQHPRENMVRLRIRRLLRLVIYSFSLTLLATLVYSRFFGRLRDQRPGVNHNVASGVGITQLQEIPPEFVPRERNENSGGGGSSGDGKRLMFVGDVHGMYDELQHLLSKLSFDHRRDQVVFLGDLVSKGPDSKAVLNWAIKHKALCVRGNQDDRVLLHRNSEFPSHDPSLTIERSLADSLNRQQVQYLESCPLILTAERVAGLGNIAAVHAGLLHGVSLKKQDPKSVMTMRTVDKASLVPLQGKEKRGRMHWADLWNRGEKIVERPLTVVYGHYAARGIDIRKNTKGLDGNCVRGGKLAALVVQEGEKPMVESVRCRKMYE